MRTEGPTSTPLQHLGFLVGSEEYAVNILQVREIIQYTPVTRVPSLPTAIRGVVNLRGRVVPVVDLAVRFGGRETVITKWSCIVMLEVELATERSLVGVLVDRVSQVIELTADEIEPPPSFGTSIRAEFLRGMGKADKRFILLLDVEQLLSSFEAMTREVTTPAADSGEPPVEPEGGEAGPRGAQGPRDEPGRPGEAVVSQPGEGNSELQAGGGATVP